MVDLKTLSSPKFAIPIIGLLILVVVTTLVAIFYIRNPSVTDGIFSKGGDETTTSSSFSTQSDTSNEHASLVTTGHLSASVGSSEHTAVTAPATTEPTTQSMTTAGTPLITTQQLPVSTPMRAIEPSQHL